MSASGSVATPVAEERIEVEIKMPGGGIEFVDVSQQALDKVLFDFNPTADRRVAKVMALHAALIQLMMDNIDDQMNSDEPGHGPEAKTDCAVRAVDMLEVTQMLCVKSYFAKA